MMTLVNPKTCVGCINYLHTMMQLFLQNWSELSLALISALSTYTALTETNKDDKALNVLQRIIQAIVLGKSRRRK